MIRCELCRRAELTPLQRLKEDALNLFLGPTPAQRLQHAMERAGATMLRAAMGAPATAYERHREEFVRTGEPEELQRMLRHVGNDG